MIIATPHIQELDRQHELESYSVLDSLPEIDFDNLTAIAAQICGTSISLISLIDKDRQWFKSKQGYKETETPRDYAFCAHAINDQDNTFIIKDATKDERFHDNPLVVGDPYVVFYAGVPLVNENGMPLGTLCVIDHKSKELSELQLASLKALSNQVMNLLELRKTKKLLENSLSELEEKNEDLQKFAYVAAHDLKSPLIGISSMTQLFTDEYANKIDDEGLSMLDMIDGASTQLKDLIDGLLEYSCGETNINEDKKTISIDNICHDLKELFSYEKNLNLNIISSLKQIHTNSTVLNQILINLIANAIKYNDKETVIIDFGISEDNDTYYFYVRDNGPGIDKEHQQKIFNIFQVCASIDKFGKAGNGIGLATVKKLTSLMGGSINVESEEGKGSVFHFSLKK